MACRDKTWLGHPREIADVSGVEGKSLLRGRLEEVIDLGAGFWIWRVRHPYWKPSDDWDPVVTTTVVKSRGEVFVIDPIAPDDAAKIVWERLDVDPPTQLVVVKPDHVRDVDWFADRYGATAWGPGLVDPTDIPSTRLSPIYPGTELPGGIVALNAGRWGVETPLWLPDQQTLVFADALTERNGGLRIWSTPWDEAGPRHALGRLLRLPFKWVIISHGFPVHGRQAYVRALKWDPWMSDELKEWAQTIEPYRKLLGLQNWPTE